MSTPRHTLDMLVREHCMEELHRPMLKMIIQERMHYQRIVMDQSQSLTESRVIPSRLFIDGKDTFNALLDF